MADRDLTLGVQVVGAPEAKAQLDSLKQSTDNVAAAQTSTVSSSAAATGALSAEAVASREAAVAADAHVVAFNAQQAASQRVIVALTEARASLNALAASAVEGGSVMTAALGRAAIAVAGLEAEIAVAQTQGIVTPAQTAGLETYKARLATLVGSLDLTSTATGKAAGQSHILRVANEAAAGAALGHAGGLSRLGGALLGLVTGPVGLFITAATLLPTLINAIIDGTNKWSKALGDTIAGLNEQDGVTRKANESTEEYTARVNRAKDAQALHERALYAATAGLIANEASAAKLDARYIIMEETLHKGRISAEQLAKAYKELGIAQAESVKVEDAQKNITTFMQIYETKLKEGKNAARDFADANESNIKRWMQAYEDAGKDIPFHLLEIAKAHDVMTHAQKIAADNTKELREMQNMANEDARKFRMTTDELAQVMLRYGSVAKAAAAGALDLDPGFIKISTGARVAKGSVDDLLDSLNSLSESTRRFDEVSERAFDVGEEVE